MTTQADMRIGLVGLGTGGPSTYHARSFSMILNGPPRVTPGDDWPSHEVRVPGARVTAVLDDDAAWAQAHADAFDIEHVCASVEEMLGLVDGVMILDDLSLQHQTRAIPFIDAGMPTFIDKPLSMDIAEAGQLLARARARGTALMSASALRFATEIAEHRAAIDAAGQPVFAVAACQGQYLGDASVVHYGVHPLELAYAVLRPTISSAQNIGQGDSHVVRYEHADGTLMLIVDPGITQAFRLTVMGSDGDVSVVGADWDGFYAGMLSTWVDAVRTRTSPIPLEETHQLIGALIAARDSKRAGGAVVPVTSALPDFKETS